MLKIFKIHSNILFSLIKRSPSVPTYTGLSSYIYWPLPLLISLYCRGPPVSAYAGQAPPLPLPHGCRGQGHLLSTSHQQWCYKVQNAVTRYTMALQGTKFLPIHIFYIFYLLCIINTKISKDGSKIFLSIKYIVYLSPSIYPSIYRISPSI